MRKSGYSWIAVLVNFHESAPSALPEAAQWPVCRLFCRRLRTSPHKQPSHCGSLLRIAAPLSFPPANMAHNLLIYK
jgi:hypothetical protein